MKVIFLNLFPMKITYTCTLSFTFKKICFFLIYVILFLELGIYVGSVKVYNIYKTDRGKSMDLQTHQ